MNDIRFGMNEQIVPLVSPVDLVATDSASPFIKLNNCHWVTFLAQFGTITGDTCDITIEVATAASSGSEVAIGFRYRLSGAVGSDTWGAVTTADSAGVAVTASDDDKILAVEYDPTENPDYNYVRLVATTAGSMSACEYGLIAVLAPRYGQLDALSST